MLGGIFTFPVDEHFLQLFFPWNAWQIAALLYFFGPDTEYNLLHF
jgi:hypothetical protein